MEWDGFVLLAVKRLQTADFRHIHNETVSYSLNVHSFILYNNNIAIFLINKAVNLNCPFKQTTVNVSSYIDEDFFNLH